MVVYSNSRISVYERCPYQYKLRYIDKVKPEFEAIELFLGDLVHRTLEKVYRDLKFCKQITKKELLDFYRKLWDKEFSSNILVVKDYGPEDYKKVGEKCIANYYDRFKPFDQLTILGIETKDKMTLPDGNQWHVRIDKLACDDKGNYYVCDYKTNSQMKNQDEADSDRQLAMYSIWVKDKFKDAKSVKLVWHMLTFDKDIVSERTEEQEKKLQEEVMALIREIKEATKKQNFPKNHANCDYCDYRSLCPSFKHKIELEAKKEVRDFKEDDGVKLVDDFSDVRRKLKELGEREEKLKSELIEFAKFKDIDVVYGSNMKADIREFDKLVLPENEDEYKRFIELLKSKGHWEECSMICYPRIQSKVIKEELHPDLIEKVRLEKDKRISLSKRKDLEE